MTGYLSNDGYLGIAKQASKGTAVAPSKFLRLAAAENVEHSQELLESYSLNSGRELDVMYKTAHKIDGGFQTFARPDMAAFLIAMALGADTISGAAVPYTHVLKKAATIPWVTIERKLVSPERIKDCKINQIVISGNSGQPVLIDVSFLGTDATIESAATATYETEVPFMFYNGVYTLDGGAITNIPSFTITINNNLEDIFTTDYKRNDMLEGKFTIDAAFRLKMESDTQFLAAYYGGSTALVNTIDDGSLIIDLSYGTSTALRGLKIELPALKHITVKKNLDPEPKAVYIDITSKAIKSAGEIITVTAKNSVTTAYI
ncbi:MAG: phage tail tube protein [Candidatus Humimicrobiaceae bacterium]